MDVFMHLLLQAVVAIPDFLLEQIDFFTYNGLKLIFTQSKATEAQQKAVVILLWVIIEGFAIAPVKKTPTIRDDVALKEIKQGLLQHAKELDITLPELYPGGQHISVSS